MREFTEMKGMFHELQWQLQGPQGLEPRTRTHFLSFSLSCHLCVHQDSPWDGKGARWQLRSDVFTSPGLEWQGHCRWASYFIFHGCLLSGQCHMVKVRTRLVPKCHVYSWEGDIQCQDDCNHKCQHSVQTALTSVSEAPTEIVPRGHFYSRPTFSIILILQMKKPSVLYFHKIILDYVPIAPCNCHNRGK